MELFHLLSETGETSAIESQHSYTAVVPLYKSDHRDLFGGELLSDPDLYHLSTVITLIYHYRMSYQLYVTVTSQPISIMFEVIFS